MTWRDIEKYISEIEDLKSELESFGNIAPEILRKVENKIRLEFNYNSNHIEGNTLTYGETQMLLMFGNASGDHNLRDYNEMKAHDVALKMIQEWASNKDHILREVDVKNLNKIILVEPFYKDAITFDGSQTKRKIEVGDYKKFPNSVRTPSGEIFEFASVSDTPILMQELLEWLSDNLINKNTHPIIIASLFHYKFIRIHPFDDGNGRITRLIMNYILLKFNYPILVIKTQDRSNYLRALNYVDIKNSNIAKLIKNDDIANIDIFVKYLAENIKWSFDLYIKAAKGLDIE